MATVTPALRLFERCIFEPASTIANLVIIAIAKLLKHRVTAATFI
jgi:hypothetical protein